MDADLMAFTITVGSRMTSLHRDFRPFAWAGLNRELLEADGS